MSESCACARMLCATWLPEQAHSEVAQKNKKENIISVLEDIYIQSAKQKVLCLRGHLQHPVGLALEILDNTSSVNLDGAPSGKSTAKPSAVPI